jgi:acyl carrier protein
MMQKSLAEIFAHALAIELSEVNDDLAYNVNPAWDSVSHMILVAALEDAYGIMLDTDDVIDLSSMSKCRDILSKYGVSI